MSRRSMEAGTPLLVGGALGLAAASNEVFGVLRVADLGTPFGRFAAGTQVLPHLAPLMVGAGFVVLGITLRGRSQRQWLAAGVLAAIALACLIALSRILPDAAALADGVSGYEVVRYRGQVIRSLLYLTSIAILFFWSAWKLTRRDSDLSTD